jgi:hypothetical protein
MRERNRFVANYGGTALNGADNGASVFTSAFKADQRRADADHLAFGAEKTLDAPCARRGNFDDGLGSLDGYERLVDFDILARGHAPLDEFRLLQSFSKIWESKYIHACSITLRTPSMMRSTLGI